MSGVSVKLKLRGRKMNEIFYKSLNEIYKEGVQSFKGMISFTRFQGEEMIFLLEKVKDFSLWRFEADLMGKSQQEMWKDVKV